MVALTNRSQDCGFKWAANHQTGHTDGGMLEQTGGVLDKQDYNPGTLSSLEVEEQNLRKK